MLRTLAVGLLMVLGAACGPPLASALLADAPPESQLPEPAVTAAALLRPAIFGYAPGAEGLAIRGCGAPLEYALGTVDPRFGLGRKQALAALQRAVGFWEGAARRKLFRYSPRSRFRIHFVFDERQEMLAKHRGERDAIADVQARFHALEQHRAQMIASYRSRMLRYQATVADWNGRGGAPPYEKELLDREKRAIAKLRDDANDLVSRLNALAADINSRGRQLSGADLLILAGKTWRTERAGMLTSMRIDIFMFASWDALQLIVAHELGHALGMRHVDAPGSLMHGGPQPRRTKQPSAADLGELQRVCPQP